MPKDDISPYIVCLPHSAVTQQQQCTKNSSTVRWHGA